MCFKKIFLLATAYLLVDLPAQALSSRDFKPFLSQYEFYSSHARHGDIVLLAVDDEGARFAYILNLKTKRKFKILHDRVQASGNIELIFFAEESDTQPEASGINASDLKDIKVEFLYRDGSCQRYELIWSSHQNAYLLGNQGRGKCFIKTNR